MHHQAALALKALKIKAQQGPYAARRFAVRNHVLGLFRLAQQLEGATQNGF